MTRMETAPIASAHTRLWRSDADSVRIYGTSAFGREAMRRLIGTHRDCSLDVGAWLATVPSVYRGAVSDVLHAMEDIDQTTLDLHFGIWNHVGRDHLFAMPLRCKLCADWHQRSISCGAAQVAVG